MRAIPRPPKELCVLQPETISPGQPWTEYPLSYGQQRLWFLHRLDSGDSTYNTSYVYRLKGRLDTAALEASFTAVAARHESLRTRFREVAGEPVAVVEPPAPIVVERLTAADEEQARTLVSTVTNTSFDLAAAPPFRVALIELGPLEHVLCVVLHHINGDGWSLNVLCSEVAAHYAGGGVADLPALPLQYGEHARAQRAAENTELRWWVEHLTGVSPLDLPADRPRPAQRSGEGGEVHFQIGGELAAGIAELARRSRCTPYMVLLSAYQVLLARHTGQDDFCVGTPSAGRDSTDLETMIGFLSTTLALRCDLSGDPSFADLLKRTRKVVLNALSRQDVPFERLVAELDVERDLSRTPLFQTLFAFHTHGETGDPLPGLDAEPFPHGWTRARVDLSMDLTPTPDGHVLGTVLYSTDLFEQRTAERMVARFVRLLEAAIAAPETPIGALPMLPEAELALLGEWNETSAELPEVTLVDLVLDQAAASPGAVAVGTLTYAELTARAADLAGRLAAAGIGRDSLVAVRMERGTDMVVALLGVAMSGAAYLPVDPEYPQARVSYVIEDSGAALVLTSLDDLPPAQAVSHTRPRPRDTAYVLYTSGSTGRPKGVVVPHRALTNFLLAMRTLVGSTSRDVWLALTSLSFDISALELYLPLVTGGRIVVADAETARDGAALARLVQDEGVTHVQATPSGWRVLLSGDLPRVTALTGGEPLAPQLARELRPRVERLVNVYGPTETTIWSTAWEVPEEPGEIVIGGPIANTVVHVLDPAGSPAPIGVPGELLIGGDGVATGYLGRPALTAERFVPGPGGSRVYRTGDLARWRGDGTLEFLGRTDNQVKLRGHRIELGEIEAVLDTCPGVAQAVVAVRGERLAAFVVPVEPGDPGLLDAVREHAGGQLPAYMVPGVLVEVATLPLTPNGKIDRKALPDVEAAPRTGATAPRTPAERLVAQVFSEVLDVPSVGAHDDFFSLGGHSLLATMVTSRLAVLSGIEVPVREVFLRPGVAALAELLTGAEPARDGRDDEGPLPRPEGAGQPLSFGQERLWFLNRLDPDDASYNMCLVRRLRGPLDRTALARAFEGVTARHESLRTRFPEVDGAPSAVVDPPGPVPVEEISAAGEAEALDLVAGLTNRPFADLADRPPLRAVLIEIGEDDHVLCVVIHHILGDGWSLNLIFEELGHLYSGGAELPPVPLQFGDVAHWQRERDTSALLDHWRERLADPTPLDLPLDRPRTAAGTRDGDVVEVRLTAAQARELALLGRRHGATMFMVLLAAYQVLLARHTGQDDVLVGTATAGRDRVQLEPVVGYLSDTLVLRGDLSGDPAFTELLERTQIGVLDAFSHQGVPFEELVTALRAERDLTRTPLFQTMFILHTQDGGQDGGAFAGLTASAFEHGMRQAKLELALEAWQDEHELLLTLVYDTALFDRATVEALGARLRLLLTALPGAADERISALPLRTEEDEALLARLGEGPALPATPSVPELVAAAVRERPDAVAVGCGTRALTYAELDARAGELAGLLRSRGVTPGDVVGVRLGRTPDTIAALLAVWRAGAAYLPLDPDYPAERLAFLVEDSGASFVLDTVPESVPQALQAGPVPDGAAAYVIYTSGSTGTPKGVVVGHDGLAARVAWMRQAYGLHPGDRVVQFASLSFDTHAEEIYPALAAGARVELLPDGGVTLPDHLAGVTVLDLPTAYWHALVDQIDDVPWPDTLRLVILGGEQVHEAAVARWRERFGDRVRLVNTYGPTETTIIATTAELDGSPGRPPIGTPVGGTRVLVLDRNGQPVPPGVPGELCVTGAGVAQGYLGRPALTAERFVPGPGGSRVYRTGDRVRWRNDGRLEFLGRDDDQVKVRGFRVELGEVEARLLACPGVGQAAVAVRDGILVGYTVGAPEGEDLARLLGATLPAYMVPSLWVRLDALPLNRNGKIDRAALPAPQAAPRERVAPRGDAEQLVADVFGEVLGIEDVGAFDDFFALGGHSLLATRVIARIRALVEIDVPIRVLFARGTVAGLAASIEEMLIAELAELSDDEAEGLVQTSQGNGEA
ncbi:amino acid adenylation domain-containing protein [Streptosporangium sp. NPDC000239]|uniref:amino acid adenylation domain-containing protein n=1 Tax=Streptosporangium sp. NPDC000239 TaxID=3154248 RepID=UPI00332A2A7F